VAGGKSEAPESVAAATGDILNAIVRAQQAPDAVHYAGPLLKLQMQVLDMVHGQMKGGQQGGPPAPPGQGGGAPPGAGGPPGGSPLMGGIAGMQGGAPQGPSSATSGAGPSTSGMDPEQMRQMALLGGNQ
jgi:hypothetical protein